MTLTKRQTATVLAALRYWQNSVIACGDKGNDVMPDHFEECTPLSSEQIDVLCERINCEEY